MSIKFETLRGDDLGGLHWKLVMWRGCLTGLCWMQVMCRSLRWRHVKLILLKVLGRIYLVEWGLKPVKWILMLEALARTQLGGPRSHVMMMLEALGRTQLGGLRSHVMSRYWRDALGMGYYFRGHILWAKFKAPGGDHLVGLTRRTRNGWQRRGT